MNHPDYQGDVRKFMFAMGQTVRPRPECPDDDVRDLRMRLIKEETDELLAALRDGDMEGIADGVADVIYVAIGTTLAYGVDLDPIWREVQRANMDKTSGPVREDGKRLKPEDWRGPDIEGILEAQSEE